MIKFDVVVEPGEIVLNTIDLLIDDPHVKIYHIDGRSKYYEILAIGHDDMGIQLMLTANERTLKKNQDTDSPTVIRFNHSSPNQNMKYFGTLYDGGKYSCYFGIYELDYREETNIVWQSSDDE